MDRRSFLSRSALGSSAILVGVPAIGAAGCGAATVRPELASGEARALVARLERGLSAVRAVPSGEMARQMRGHPQPALAESILRLGLEAFVVADVARSVPEGASMPAQLSERIATEQHLVDRYTNTYHGLLSRMPAPARRRLDAKFRAQPEIGMDMAGWVDEHASHLDVPTESRLKLRHAASSVTTRMRRQSTNAVIDDCLAKVDRVVARSGASLSLARSIATGAMIDAIWQQVEGVPQGSGGLGAPGPDPAPAQVVIQPVPSGQWSRRWGRPGDEEIEIGAVMMPFGLLTCGLLLIIGLIVLIAGCVQNSDWDGTPQAVQAAR